MNKEVIGTTLIRMVQRKEITMEDLIELYRVDSIEEFEKKVEYFLGSSYIIQYER